MTSLSIFHSISCVASPNVVGHNPSHAFFTKKAVDLYQGFLCPNCPLQGRLCACWHQRWVNLTLFAIKLWLVQWNTFPLCSIRCNTVRVVLRCVAFQKYWKRVKCVRMRKTALARKIGKKQSLAALPNRIRYVPTKNCKIGSWGLIFGGPFPQKLYTRMY